jgi:hypothetical protein
MKSVFLLVITVFSVNAFGTDISCPKVESRSEGHWPLPAEAFTLERYKKAIEHLNGIVKVNAEGRDYINVENELMYIEGFMLKLHNETTMFCEFIKNEAYVRH